MWVYRCSAFFNEIEKIFEIKYDIEKYIESNNTVMTHSARLREKMHEPARKPKYVKTVWGVGYKIEN